MPLSCNGVWRQGGMSVMISQPENPVKRERCWRDYICEKSVPSESRRLMVLGFYQLG